VWSEQKVDHLYYGDAMNAEKTAGKGRGSAICFVYLDNWLFCGISCLGQLQKSVASSPRPSPPEEEREKHKSRYKFNLNRSKARRGGRKGGEIEPVEDPEIGNCRSGLSYWCLRLSRKLDL